MAREESEDVVSSSDQKSDELNHDPGETSAPEGKSNALAVADRAPLDRAAAVRIAADRLSSERPGQVKAALMEIGLYDEEAEWAVQTAEKHLGNKKHAVAMAAAGIAIAAVGVAAAPAVAGIGLLPVLWGVSRWFKNAEVDALPFLRSPRPFEVEGANTDDHPVQPDDAVLASSPVPVQTLGTDRRGWLRSVATCEGAGSFDMTIRHVPAGKSFRTGDPEFDRSWSVDTNDHDLARVWLRGPVVSAIQGCPRCTARIVNGLAQVEAPRGDWEAARRAVSALVRGSVLIGAAWRRLAAELGMRLPPGPLRHDQLPAIRLEVKGVAHSIEVVQRTGLAGGARGPIFTRVGCLCEAREVVPCAVVVSGVEGEFLPSDEAGEVAVRRVCDGVVASGDAGTWDETAVWEEAAKIPSCEAVVSAPEGVSVFLRGICIDAGIVRKAMDLSAGLLHGTGHPFR